ncbi:MAG: hypothetical protein CR988_01990 [Treponema sp.]|nr:MAG: hypothetical protein CR988_01990 [Treponema sp.]
MRLASAVILLFAFADSRSGSLCETLIILAAKNKRFKAGAGWRLAKIKLFLKLDLPVLFCVFSFKKTLTFWLFF